MIETGQHSGCLTCEEMNKLAASWDFLLLLSRDVPLAANAAADSPSLLPTSLRFYWGKGSETKLAALSRCSFLGGAAL